MAQEIAIELNDSGIIVSDGQQVLFNSPGYIIDLAGQEWIGVAACERAFLYPNNCSHRFWFELSQAQVDTVNQDVINLAFRHLAYIWKQVSVNVQTVILVVPATFTKTGLGLLLGICKQLSIPVRTMIHHAVLVPRQSDYSGVTIYVDVQLHCTAITRLNEQQSEFCVAQTENLNDVNLLSIYTETAEFIAQKFIRTTRLDPMHSAELEQQLFNNLPKWLRMAQSQSVVRCQLAHQGNVFEVIIESTDLQEKIKSKLNRIIEAVLSFEAQKPVIVCISKVIDEQFGFGQHAVNQGIMISLLSVGHLAKQSLLHANHHLLNDDSQIYLNKKLPYFISNDPLLMPKDEGLIVSEQPTHILFCHRAYAIEDILYFINSEDEGFQLKNDQLNLQCELVAIRKSQIEITVEVGAMQNVTINNQALQSHDHVSLGDCMRVAGCPDELTFIKVER